MTPFATGVQVSMRSPQRQIVGRFEPPVPAGKRFVADYINGRATLPNGQLCRLTVFIGGRQLYFAPDFAGRDFSTDNFVLSETIHMAHSPGEEIRLNMTRFPANTGEASAHVTLSGRLVDA